MNAFFQYGNLGLLPPPLKKLKGQIKNSQGPPVGPGKEKSKERIKEKNEEKEREKEKEKELKEKEKDSKIYFSNK